MIQQSGGRISISIKTMNGSQYEVKAASTSNIASLQGQIEQKTGVPIGAQRLLFRAVMLEPLKSLQDYGIVEGDVIKLVANRIPSQASVQSTFRQSEVQRTNALTQQNLRYKKHRYIQQRINGFNIKISDGIQALRQNKGTLDRLIRCLNKQEGARMPFLLQNRQLEVGDWVDVREVSGSWVEGQIIKKYSNFVQVHYNGLSEHWNEWIAQSSQRIMPFKSQTIQSEESSSLSPFPMNQPFIRNPKPSRPVLEEIIRTLPETFETVSSLLSCLNLWKQYSSQQQEYQNISFKNNRSQHSPPQSIQQQEYQYDMDLQEGQDNVAMLINDSKKDGNSNSIKGTSSFKNGNHSIHYHDNRINRVVNRFNRAGLANMNNPRIKSIIRYTNHNLNQGQGVATNTGRAESQAGNTEPWGFSYSKTKSEHEHEQVNGRSKHMATNTRIIGNGSSASMLPGGQTAVHYEEIDEEGDKISMEKQQINEEQLPQKTMKRHIIFDKSKQDGEEEDDDQGEDLSRNKKPKILSQPREDDQRKSLKSQSKEKKPFIQTDSENFQPFRHPSSIDSEGHHEMQNISEQSPTLANFLRPTQQAPSISASIQADNLSNKCEQNLSNKGEQDDGEISAKSFGSKRSERLLDASSMKSLIIDTSHHNQHNNKSQEKDKNIHRRNIFVVDQSEAQSVTSAKNKNNHHSRSNYCYNQEGIMEEEDSYNDDLPEEFYIRKKHQNENKLKATQLAPLCDRLGRLLVDLAPHLASLGYTEYFDSSQYNENLSTFTNEGSLQSRLRNLSMRGGQHPQPSTTTNLMRQQQMQEERPMEQTLQHKQSSHSNIYGQSNYEGGSRYWNFQVPVMLTPWQIMRINRLLRQEANQGSDQQQQ